MMKKIAIFASVTFPYVAFAAAIDPNDQTIQNIITFLTGPVISILIVVATIVFLFGIIRYVTAGGDEEKIKSGRNMMIFGIIALAVMIGVWGLVQILVDTFGIGGTQIPPGIGPDSGLGQ